MRVMICLGQGGLRSLSASSLTCFIVSLFSHFLTRTVIEELGGILEAVIAQGAGRVGWGGGPSNIAGQLMFSSQLIPLLSSLRATEVSDR